MNWQDILACPDCLTTLRFPDNIDQPNTTIMCNRCQKRYYVRNYIISFPDPPCERREYLFEINRYNRIARSSPKDYHGLDESQPLTRVKILQTFIENTGMYLNIGPGFGQLEEALPDATKICIDQCIGFLELLQRRKLSNIYFVNGFAERMPFKTGVFPTVISDSVWTTAVNQRDYLIENARVLKMGGLLLLATNYRWNYPRKPQSFPVSDPKLLLHYLNELGIEASAIYFNLEDVTEPSTYEEGQYLLIHGMKTRQCF